MSLARYVDWMRTAALPFWLRKAVDESGQFYETLALDGTPQPAAELRLRTGMRQVYVFAHAAHLGWADRAACLARAERLVERIRACAWAPDGRPGWIARFTRGGEVTSRRRDLYDHAFTLLALGHLYQATHDARYATWIDETLSVIDTVLAAPHGGWAESDAEETPRRQNPHMHLFEASLALFETTGAAKHLARAGEIYGLFRSRFFDDATGFLTEFFGPAWEPGLEFHSERMDPGHMCEWTWLLRRYERATGRPVGRLCAALFANALRLGPDSSGFLVDEVDAAGHPLIDRRRLWLQTEYLKALIVQAAAEGKTELLRRANVLAERLLGTYLAGVPQGTWMDQFTCAGQPSATVIPASSLYHLFVAAVDTAKALGTDAMSARNDSGNAAAEVEVPSR